MNEFLPRRAAASLVLLFLISSLCFSQPFNPPFSPAHYQTIICPPDDWLKTMVSEKGALTYDYGPGPYARPLTEVSIGLKGTQLPVIRQYLEDARVPIVTTIFRGEGEVMRQETFSLVPRKSWARSRDVQNPLVTRLGGLNGCIDWAVPPPNTDFAFRNVAWGTNRPIKYRVRVEPGSRKLVAMALCESYKWGPGTRIVELRVEGGEPVTVSTMKDSVKNRPYVYLFHAVDADSDGQLAIEAHASPKSPDPNVILNGFWVFPSDIPFPVTEEALIQGRIDGAYVHYPCGGERERSSTSMRVDAIRATLSGDSVSPVISVRTRRDMNLNPSGIFRGDGYFYIFSRPTALSATRNAEGWTLDLPAGTRTVDVFVVHAPILPGPKTGDIASLDSEIKQARDYWIKNKTYPNNRIVVPDSSIQYVLDASVRTMYQVRDSVEGHVQFQPGPTVYRGLWAGDAMLTGVSVMTLGDTIAARGFMETVLRHQLPSGQIRSLYPAVSMPETPAAVTAFCIYAKTFGDKPWLRKQWPRILSAMEWIERMHGETMKDPSARDYGLMPPSFIDGGIADVTADYNTVWWTAIALERVIDAARWLGLNENVPRWKHLLENLSSAWKKAARGDLKKDRFGNTYLPVIIGDTSHTSPQRGQFAFLCPFPYAGFFQENDSLTQTIVHGNLAMLDSTLQEGLVCGSGWIPDGVWPWLGGVHGIAHDLAGNGSRATELLYAFANHATPTGTWNEEQNLKTKPERSGGDVSDAEASAVFIYHVRRLLVRERRDSLELLAGFPNSWLKPGSNTALNRLFTEFGPLSLRMKISPDGSRADLYLSAIDGRGSNGTPVIFLGVLKRCGFTYADGRPLPERLTWKWRKELRLQCRRTPREASQAK